MLEPDSLNPSKFLGHVGRSFCFAVPVGGFLWLIYFFFYRISSGCPGTTYDRSTDLINMGFILVLNCFLAALNPLLFCLFEIWSFWHNATIGDYRAPGNLFCFGAVPVIAYIVVAVKKGWLQHSSVIGSKPRQKIGITIGLCLVLIPFQNQILKAPTNIINSIRLLTLNNHIDVHPTYLAASITARTLAKTLGEAGQHEKAMEVLLGAMDQDLKSGCDEHLRDDFSILAYIDPANELSKAEWLRLTKPVEERITAAFDKFRNNDEGFKTDNATGFWLTKTVIARFKDHGAYEEAPKYQRMGNAFKRLKDGEKWSGDCLNLVKMRQGCHYDDEALAILQESMALSEAYYSSHKFEDTPDSSYEWRSHFAWMNEGIERYEQIASTQPATSWHRQNLSAWKNSRSLHEKAYSLMKKKDFQAAEPLLLKAQSFDLADKSCGRAWSIYQNLLGAVELRLDKYNEAEKHYQLALQNDLSIAPKGLSSADVARDVGLLAALRQKQGRFAEAGQLFAQALAIDQQVLGEFALETKGLEANLIALNTSQKKYKENEELYKQAILKAQNRQKPDEVLIERTNGLASFYLEQKDYLRAEEQVANASRLSRKNCEWFNKPTIVNLDILGDHYLRQSNYAKAQLLYEQASQLVGKNPSDREQPARLDKFTQLYIAKRDFIKAAETAKTALFFRQKVYNVPKAELQRNEAEYLALVQKTTGKH